MDIKNYTLGKGIDVSRVPILEKCDKIFIEPDNLYSFREFYDYESLDFIYSKDLINETKFFKILIKEWFYFCKVNGKIIIELQNNRILSFDELEKECLLLLKDKIEIIYKEFNKDADSGIVVLKKIKSSLEKKDRIDSWTFGILTNGKRDEVVDKEIESILNLKIPHFEVIICGAYANKKNFKIKQLDFNPEIPWITKKKNLICENAKYENIVVTHDRYTFDKDWFEGMKKFGNYFEVLSCVIKDPEENRTCEWITLGTDLNDPKFIGRQGSLEYKDWDKNLYIDGGFYILKKSSWLKSPWNNNLLWGEHEDFIISRDFYNIGLVIRYNPYSTCHTFVTKKQLPLYMFNNQRLGKITNQPFKDRVRHFIKINLIPYPYCLFREAYHAMKKFPKKEYYPKLK